MPNTETHPIEIRIPVDSSFITGDLHLVKDSQGLIIFAHGSGSSRFSRRNQYVATQLNNGRFSTLLFDLLTPEEERVDLITREYRFNIPLLAERLVLVSNWIKNNPETTALPLGYFGSSTGAAAALIAATQVPYVQAIVSRGGRPDLAEGYLTDVHCPTLLIVGSNDHEVITLNQYALNQLTCTKQLVLIPHATHLFEEPGTLEAVTKEAQHWFTTHLSGKKQ
jgi:pimeloyl-ACP methyl ester carboxylesterase